MAAITPDLFVKILELKPGLPVNNPCNRKILLKGNLVCLEQTEKKNRSSQNKTLSFWDQQGNHVQTFMRENVSSVFLTKKALILETHNKNEASLDIYLPKRLDGPFKKTQSIPCSDANVIAKRDYIILGKVDETNNATLTIYKFDDNKNQFQEVQKIQTVWEKNQFLNLKGPYLNLSNNQNPKSTAKTWKEQDGVLKEHPSLTSDPHRIVYSKGDITVLECLQEKTAIAVMPSAIFFSIGNLVGQAPGTMTLSGNSMVFRTVPDETNSSSKTEGPAEERKVLVEQMRILKNGKEIEKFEGHRFISMKSGYLISSTYSTYRISKQNSHGEFEKVDSIKREEAGLQTLVNVVAGLRKNWNVKITNFADNELNEVLHLSKGESSALKGNRLYTVKKGKVVVSELNEREKQS